MKSEKESIFNDYFNLKKDFDNLRRNQDVILNEQIEKYKQESYFYKCGYEELKNKIDATNEKNVNFFLKKERNFKKKRRNFE